MKKETIEFIDKLIKEQQLHIESAQSMLDNARTASRQEDDAKLIQSKAERMIETFELIKKMEELEKGDLITPLKIRLILKLQIQWLLIILPSSYTKRYDPMMLLNFDLEIWKCYKFRFLISLKWLLSIDFFFQWIFQELSRGIHR